MASESKVYTNLAVLEETKRKIVLLATVRRVEINAVVETWASAEWEKAKKEGLVTDAMLDVHWVDSPKKKSKKSAKKGGEG